MIARLLDLDPIPTPADAADALGLAITHVHAHKLKALARRCLTSSGARSSRSSEDAAVISLGGVGVRVEMPTRDLAKMRRRGHRAHGAADPGRERPPLRLRDTSAAASCSRRSRRSAASARRSRSRSSPSTRPTRSSGAIATGDAGALALVSGVGKKTAGTDRPRTADKLGVIAEPVAVARRRVRRSRMSAKGSRGSATRRRRSRRSLADLPHGRRRADAAPSRVARARRRRARAVNNDATRCTTTSRACSSRSCRRTTPSSTARCVRARSRSSSDRRDVKEHLAIVLEAAQQARRDVPAPACSPDPRAWEDLARAHRRQRDGGPDPRDERARPSSARATSSRSCRTSSMATCCSWTRSTA